MVFGPAAEVLALAALALATDRHATLGGELLEFGTCTPPRRSPTRLLIPPA
jgi:hypothetical protein